jgi:hypothetical protein
MKKGSEVLYLGSIFAGGNGPNGIKYASTTVLWPFVAALDEAYSKFLIEDAQNRELKAKQEAEAKVAAELKAKQEAEATAAKAAAELKAKQEAEARATAELIAKQEAEIKAAQDAAAKAAAAKRTTITCVKGKTVKKVTGIKPVCPKGYKKR